MASQIHKMLVKMTHYSRVYGWL